MARKMVCIAALVSFLAGAAFAAENKTPEKQAADAKAMEEAFMKASTPGAEHQRLAGLEGQWKATVKMWQDPSKPAETSEGTCEMKMILGGRYLQQNHKGTAMGQPFEGVGLTAYDNMKKKYVSTWIDNMGTGVLTWEGLYDASSSSITMMGEYMDPMSGKMKKSRTVTKIVSPDQQVFEMYDKASGAKEMKVLEITYDRMK